MGCHWPATALLARPALLRSPILLLAWCNSSGYPAGTAKEVQDRIPEPSKLPPGFPRNGYDVTRNAYQLHDLGPHWLHVQLRHPSPPLQLVDQVQLYVYHFVLTTWAILGFLIR